MTTRLTKKQRELLARIQAGEVRSAQTGDRVGNQVACLIRRGVVTYRHRSYHPPSMTYWGRRIKGSMCWSGLTVEGER
jgi:hypothetical protein